MVVRDSSIRPEGDCCGTDRVIGINSRQLSCLTNFLHHVVKFIDAERLVVVPNGIGRRPVSARILEKCRTFGAEFGKIVSQLCSHRLDCPFHTFVHIFPCCWYLSGHRDGF